MAEPKREAREAPVSFRPGKLRSALRNRAVRTAAEGQIAKRDLGRYYLLIGRVLLDDRLTRREASWLAQAAFAKSVDDWMSGNPFIPEHIDPGEELLSIVHHALRAEERSRREPSSIAVKVVAKIEAMTPLERAALMDAVDRLPAQAEEEVSDPGNWALIGVRLAENEAEQSPT
ncbi:MAG: hypothetical protein WD981_02285 [Gaiellaceae bacterium]